MRFGKVNLFCPICGSKLIYNDLPPYSKPVMHHREFGICCAKLCWDEAEMKYARMILGKDDS